MITRLAGALPLLLFLLAAAPGRGADADTLWKELVAGNEPPDLPEAWEQRAPGEDERQRFVHGMASASATNAELARTFYQRFPNDRHAHEARLLEARQLAIAAHFGLTNRANELAAAKRALPPSLSDEERFFVESGVAYRLDYLEQSRTGMSDLGAFEREARRLRREFPGLADADDLFLDVAKAHFGRDRFDTAKALARELLSGKTTAGIKEGAESVVTRAGLVGKPLMLRFAALDGREVDLEKLRGKVVLIDAWATWCTICMEKLPALKQTYAELHPKGLEVVGLNFDDSRAAVEKLIAKEKIAWPNYFDGKGWENKYGAQFKIVSLPTLWLIDKKGTLRELNAHENTREKIEKLLAE